MRCWIDMGKWISTVVSINFNLICHRSSTGCGRACRVYARQSFDEDASIRMSRGVISGG